MGFGGEEDGKIFPDYIFENNTQIILEQIYTQEQEQNLVETSVCLSGYTQDNNSKYYISSLFYPEIYEQSFNHVNFESCPNDTLIMLHTHPYKRCLASKTDIKTLNNVKKNSPNTIMIVMCENNKFSVYS